MKFKKPRRGPLLAALTVLLILNLVLIATTTGAKEKTPDIPASIPVETQEVIKQDDAYMDEFNRAFNSAFDNAFQKAQEARQ